MLDTRIPTKDSEFFAYLYETRNYLLSPYRSANNGSFGTQFQVLVV